MRGGGIILPEGFAITRLARGADPITSLIAAQKASKASAKAITEVAEVMKDGQIRIDEEIWLACRTKGYCVTQDTIEHARLALSEAGILLWTGHTKHTTNNTPAREWVWSGSTQAPGTFEELRRELGCDYCNGGCDEVDLVHVLVTGRCGKDRARER